MHSLGLLFQSLMLRIWFRLRWRHWNSYGSQLASLEMMRQSETKKKYILHFPANSKITRKCFDIQHIANKFRIEKFGGK